MSQSNSWCFTLNNPTRAETILLEDLYNKEDDVTYLVFQLEQGDLETPHYQGFIQFINRKRMTQVKKILGPRAHIERTNGTAAQNRTYCTKEPRLEGPLEFGTMVEKGKRKDIEEFRTRMKEKLLTDGEILEEFPNILAKYPRFVATTRRIIAEEAVPEHPLCPRPGWQVALVERLSNEPDPRQVHWYYDEAGNSGKSIFARRYRLRGERPYVITGGKHSDIYYAYARQPVVIFDWPRSQEEAFPYAVVETFKNGYFLSTKYESTPVFFKPPHVVVFANFYPDKSKLSADRWDIHTIDNSLLN